MPLTPTPALTGLAALVLTAATITGTAVADGAVAAGPATGPASADAPARQTGRVLHVSTHGHDRASGSAAAPLRTISAAVRRAEGTGATVVVHRGTYHESVSVPRGTDVDLRAARGAQVALDGSRRVRGWTRSGDAYVHRGWRAEFDASPTYTWGAPDNTADGWSFVDPHHPMAAHPDQVWVDGRAQRQVGSRAKVRPGRFFVDYDTHRLYLGTDPQGHAVRASDRAKALSIQGAGSSVHGIDVRRYAPSVAHMGAVTVEAADVRIDHLSVSDNATTGLHVTAPDATLAHVRFQRNGMLGMSATYADGLRLLHVASRHNNTEHFNPSPVAGGAKIGRTRGVTVRGGSFSHNDGTGLWFDESTYDISVLASSMRDNRGHGLSLEISALADVAGNVVAGNHRDGIKVNDTSDVRIQNNTLVGNGRPLDIVQDDRDAADPDTPGHDPRRPVPDPTMPWVNRRVQVHDNVLARVRPSANCLLCVEDYSGRFSAEELRVTSSGNVYQRPRRTDPTWAVVWSRGAGDPDVFTSVDGFARATGQEQRHLDLVGPAAVGARLQPTDRVRRREDAVAEPLPADLARRLHRDAGSRHLGAWFGRGGAVPPTS